MNKPPDRPDRPPRPYLWCTLVMCGDFYIPGALATAASVRRWSRYPIHCMHTPDVTSAAVDTLRRHFADVRPVQYIEKRLEERSWSDKQRAAYGAWMSKSFTKWNILDSSQFGNFEKILFIDADFIITENVDELFDLAAPAMTLSSPWAWPYTRASDLRNPYTGLKHGDVVGAKCLREGLHTSFVGIGNLVLVSPSSDDWQAFQRLLSSEISYGHSGCMSGADEQAIVELYLSLNRPIHHIHQRYNWIVGKDTWLRADDKPKALHYQGVKKPWTLGRYHLPWEDLKVWWTYADYAVAHDAEAVKWFNNNNNNNNKPCLF